MIKNRYSNLLRLKILMLLGLILLQTVTVFGAKENLLEQQQLMPELEGYQVQFDYTNYPVEREIAYRYFTDTYKGNKAFSKVTINDLGIDLFDIDNDGKKEVFVYINARENCSRWGCPFVILKPLSGLKGYSKPLYTIMQLDETANTNLQTHDKIRVLKSSNLNVQDLLFCDIDGIPSSVMEWRGTYYAGPKDIDFEFLKDAYSIKFDFKNYSAEREIAYKYLLDRFPGSRREEFSLIRKEDIGIDLYDIDQDGKKEIFVTLRPSNFTTYYCQEDSCPFAILKPAETAAAKYQEVPRALEQDKRYDLNSTLNIKVLQTSSEGFHDILFFNMSNIPAEIWQWRGGKYYANKFFKQLKQ